MFDQLRYRIGLAYSRFHFRSSAPESIRWTGAISGAKRALLLLPETSQDSASLQGVVEFCTKQFAPSNVFIVGSVDAASRVKPDRRSQLVTFAPTDMNAWFLPRGELTQKMKKSTFDVAIDLNLDLALPSAYLCRSSGAQVRVGFKKIHADTFYNFQVQPQASNNFAAACHSLTECLRMF
ncbi:MAG TPA: hypothetical protein VGB10_03640 [Bacteroidota bacterium]